MDEFSDLVGDLDYPMIIVTAAAGTERAGCLVPVLEDCGRWFAGEVVERFPTEDHVGFLLAPIAVELRPWSGQLGFQAARSIPPGHEA